MNFTEFQRSEYSRQPHFLLFGNPVSHSLSPLMHNTAASHYSLEIRYHAVRLYRSELSSVAAHFNKKAFKGANITLPYKQMLIDYMDGLDSTASSIGAINTIVKKGLSIKGFNTDSYGFSVPLQKFKDELKGSRALVFGTGGATRAVIHALTKFDVQEIVLISRNPARRSEFEKGEHIRLEGYDAWAALAEDAAIIVNATPLGMEPNADSAPVREEEGDVLGNKICYDIVYKPLKTKFLSMAEAAGARTIGGLEMLIHQGSRSFELWTGKPFPIEEVRNKLYEVIQN